MRSGELVLGGSAVITGKQNGDQNIEIMIFEVDVIVLGRYYGIASSGSHIRS
jgi:hypothetical protein